MCRMLIACPNKARPLGFSILKSCSILISLGRNAQTIDRKGIGRVFKALEKCKSIMAQYKDTKVYCVATAIFRSASNAKEILASIHEKFGLAFYICDPGEEIMFSACGCRDIFADRYSFVMDMGGGSTEIGLFEKVGGQITMLKWISLPYGLFYFEAQPANVNRAIPPDSYKALQVFLNENFRPHPDHTSLIICRSGIMSIITAYISQHDHVAKSTIHGQAFRVDSITSAIDDITKMSDNEIMSKRLLSNTSHLGSTRRTIGFTRDIIKQLPIKYIILGNAGVKEGMMNLACINDA